MKPSTKSIVIFGAGKIGRSFIGQLFSLSGYKVIFIDIDYRIIDELNRSNKYCVVIKSGVEEVIEITNVCGINANDQQVVIQAITNCTLMATCVGKNALPKIVPLIAKGIENRIMKYPETPLDIILAENIRNACELVKFELTNSLSDGFPIETYIGLIETSIGKMVPNIPREVEIEDPLLVYAEPYNTLILDLYGFKNQLPKVIGLSPKENIRAWVDRKAFIHNLGHVAAAYYGYFRFPERKYLYEILEDTEVRSFMREVMDQSAIALIEEYPDVFTIADLNLHMDDLTNRFRNKSLGDSVFRIGSDLNRKLSCNDRIVGAIKLAQKHQCPYNRLLDVLIYGLFFRAVDESGQLFEGDKDFVRNLEFNLDNLLISRCGLDRLSDIDLIGKIKDKYEFLLKSKYNEK